MENPFQILGITNITREQEVDILRRRLEELDRLEQSGQDLKQTRGVLSRSEYSLIGKSTEIEDYLNERFILGLSPDKKFFSKKDLEKLFERLSDLESKIEVDPKARGFKRKVSFSGIQAKRLSQSLSEQFSKIKSESKEYSTILKNFEKGPENPQYLDALDDLYIRYIYESKVIKIAAQVASKLEATEHIEKDYTFIQALRDNSQYQQLCSAYNKVGTVQARRDLIPEMYVKSRMADTSGITVPKDAYVRTLVRREKKFKKDFENARNMTMSERYQNGIPENQEHDYGWGIVLKDSTFLMKDEPVDNPIFQGKITVENIGSFTEESMFNARRYMRERNVNTSINHLQRNDDSDRRYTLDISKSHFKKIREYAWFYEATKTLYDYIYKVTKTDNTGRTSTDIVFSPLIARDLQSQENLEFVKNIYFSDYMLGIAKQNGGYAGRIIKSPEGLSISNEYSDDEIASAVLFDRGLRGNILDCRGKNKVPYYNANKQDFLNLINRAERTR